MIKSSKTCPSCNIEFPFSEFSKFKTNCKPCSKKREAETNTELRRQYQELIENNPNLHKQCSCCHKEKTINCFSFHSTVCKPCKNSRYAKRMKKYGSLYRKQKTGKRRNYRQDLFYCAKQRARKYGLPFNLTIEDIIIPEFCPIFGIKLEKGVSRPSFNSPSLDRILPSLGYVKGNIAIISNGANTVKSYGTAEQHIKIAEYMLKAEKELALSHSAPMT